MVSISKIRGVKDTWHGTKSLCTFHAPLLPETKKEPREKITQLLTMSGILDFGPEKGIKKPC